MEDFIEKIWSPFENYLKENHLSLADDNTVENFVDFLNSYTKSTPKRSKKPVISRFISSLEELRELSIKENIKKCAYKFTRSNSKNKDTYCGAKAINDESDDENLRCSACSKKKNPKDSCEKKERNPTSTSRITPGINTPEKKTLISSVDSSISNSISNLKEIKIKSYPNLASNHVMCNIRGMKDYLLELKDDTPYACLGKIDNPHDPDYFKEIKQLQPDEIAVVVNYGLEYNYLKYLSDKEKNLDSDSDSD